MAPSEHEIKPRERRWPERVTAPHLLVVALVALACGSAWTSAAAEEASASVRVAASIEAATALSLTFCHDPACDAAVPSDSRETVSGPLIVVESGGPWVAMLCGATACGAESDGWSADGAGRTFHALGRLPATPAPAGPNAALIVAVMR